MARSKDQSWIRLYRSLLDHDLWTGEPFTTGQAWVDLLMLAAFEDVEHFYKGRFQVVKRGQIATSIRFLSRRWHWNPGRTTRTLKAFEKAKMLRVSVTRNGTLLTIENYEKFQSQRYTPGNTYGNTSGNTPGNTSGNDNKNIKNVKEGEERARETRSPDDASHGFVLIEEWEDGTKVYEDKSGQRYYIPEGGTL